jgi:hypothetical protein
VLLKDSAAGWRRFPWFLPDGRHFLYSVNGAAAHTLYVGDLKSGDSKRLLSADSNGVFVDGHLLYVREGSLVSQPFDTGRLEPSGEAVSIAEAVQNNNVIGLGVFSASTTGLVIYLGGDNGASARDTQLTWFNRSGKRLGTVGPVGISDWVRISPDGSQAVAGIQNSTGGSDVWLFGLARPTASRLTQAPRFNGMPVWSPDGKRIAFDSGREGVQRVYQRVVEGGADELVNGPIGDPPALTMPEDWSPDGRFLVERVVAGNDNLWIQPLFGDKKVYQFTPGAVHQHGARISPDGKWISYASNDSGRFEVYVQSFPMPGGKVQVSINGGERPAWSRDGKELYFTSPEGKVMASAVRAGSRFEVGEPVALFDVGTPESFSFNNSFDVTRDGRFLIPVRPERAEQTALTVLVNWTAGLKK